MPTDAQLRKQFEDWGRTYYLNLIHTRGGQYRDVLTETAYAAWLARDAEVQALRKALKEIAHDLPEDYRHYTGHIPPFDVAYRAAGIARAALAGGETGTNHE